jgi:type II secretory pathway component PulK
MKQCQTNTLFRNRRQAESGSVLVIVLLITIGLISMAIYFANSMSLELRAADNRASGLAAEQAIEGGARYIRSILSSFATNGAMPDLSEYEPEAAPVGNEKTPEDNAHFWIIGRDLSGTISSQPHFALISEASKLDLNAPWLTADMLATNLSPMTSDFAQAIVDWRNTNASGSSLNYGQSGYLPKHAPFESVGELRLVYGATLDLMIGEDVNQNGVLDANERDANGNGEADPGVLDYFTVYSREPNSHSDGTSLTNVNNQANVRALLADRLGESRATAIMGFLTGGNNGPGAQPTQFNSLLQFYVASQMTSDEFAQIYNDVTVSTNAFTVGRVNINTAPAAVLACLPGMDINTAQQLVSYRESNSANFNSIGWIVDALGRNNAALTRLAQGDYITAKTFQFTADIAAVGRFGRGYRRVRFVFDTSEGTPKIVYRRDLSRLGWALGSQTRETWVAKNTR